MSPVSDSATRRVSGIFRATAWNARSISRWLPSTDCPSSLSTTSLEESTEIWGLVNNAGFAQAGAIEDVDDDAVRYQLEVNLVAPARLARLVVQADAIERKLERLACLGDEVGDSARDVEGRLPAVGECVDVDQGRQGNSVRMIPA